MNMTKNMGMHLPLLVLIFLSLSSTTWSSSVRLNDEVESSKLHFVLVHGACFGAWSWYKVTTFLQSAGHNVTALDMASAGIDPTQPESLTSLTEYYQPLLSFMEALPSDEKIVLVGHSLGGLGISMAMEKFPEKISVAIFVTAAMPPPLWPFSFLAEELFEMYEVFYKDDESKDSGPKLFLFNEEKLATKLFQLSPPEDLTLATTLVRPQPMFSLIKSMEELHLTEQNYGSVKRAFIKSEDDKMTGKFMVWAMLTFNKPDQLAEVNGSDHMVMASKPHDLAQLLPTIAQQFANI